MTTKAKALDKLIDAIAGEDVPMTSQTVAGRLDTLADTLAGDDVTFTAQDIAGRIDELAGMIEDGTISIGGGGGGGSLPDGYVLVEKTNSGTTDYGFAYFVTNAGVNTEIFVKTGSVNEYADVLSKDGTTKTYNIYNSKIELKSPTNVIYAYIYRFNMTEAISDVEKITLK